MMMQSPIESDDTTPEKEAARSDTSKAEPPIIKKDSEAKGDTENADATTNDSGNRPEINRPRIFRRRLRKGVRIAFRVAPAITGIATLIVIVFQSRIYNGQWEVMQEQLRLQGIALEQAKDIQRRSDRAWVNVHSTGLDRLVKAWENAFSTVSFINTGKTPANNIRLEIWTGVGEPQMSFFKLPRPTPDGMVSQGVLPPASPPTPQHIKTKVPLTEAVAKAVEGGFLHVYAYGTIHYDDDAGHHSTDFCYEAREATVKTEYTACIDGNVAR